MGRDNLSKFINKFVSNIDRIKASFSYAVTEILYKLWKSYCMKLYGCMGFFQERCIRVFYNMEQEFCMVSTTVATILSLSASSNYLPLP